MLFAVNIYAPSNLAGHHGELLASWRVNAETLKEATQLALKPISKSSRNPDIIWPDGGELDVVMLIP